MYKCCIFDLDGTLINSLKSLAYTTNEVLRNFGFVPLPEEKYNYLVGRGYKNLVSSALEEVGDLDLSYYNQALIKYQEIYKENCLRDVSAYDGIKETLKILKENGMKLAVYSNKPHDRAIETVEYIFGKDMFDLILGQKENMKLKPDDEGALWIMLKLDVKPDECLYFGDTSVDMETGNNAKMDTVGVTWGFRPREELERYSHKAIIDKPSQIVDIALR